MRAVVVLALAERCERPQSELGAHVQAVTGSLLSAVVLVDCGAQSVPVFLQPRGEAVQRRQSPAFVVWVQWVTLLAVPCLRYRCRAKGR